MIKINNLSYNYPRRKEKVLWNINLSIGPGEIAVLLGSSGAGKTTLLKCISRLVEPQEGEIYIGDSKFSGMKEKEARKIRRKIGYIFQQFNLIERNSVLNNVLDGRLAYTPIYRSAFYLYKKIDIEKAEKSLERVGMLPYINSRVSDLSGGQKQRVAIARVLAQEPKIILADEPVSSLDPRLTKEIMTLLQKICLEDGITLLMSLHFLDLAKEYASKIIGINNGRIIFDNDKKELTEKDIVDIYGKTKDWTLYGKLGY